MYLGKVGLCGATSEKWVMEYPFRNPARPDPMFKQYPKLKNVL